MFEKKNMYIYIYLYLCVFLMIDSQFATKKVKQPLFFYGSPNDVEIMWIPRQKNG